MHDSGPPEASPSRVHAAQILRRRARLRCARPKDRDALVALAERMSGVAGVDRVLARPGTGSLILECHHDAGGVVEAMQSDGLIKIVPPPKAPPVRQVVQVGLMRVDAGMKQRTADALDLRTTMGVLLLAAAFLQLARGRVAGPATTLAMSAFSLLDFGKTRG